MDRGCRRRRCFQPRHQTFRTPVPCRQESQIDVRPGRRDRIHRKEHHERRMLVIHPQDSVNLEGIHHDDIALRKIELMIAGAILTPPAGRVMLLGDGDPDNVRLIVSDSGPGMTAKEQGRAFDRFSRSSRQGEHGSSLGLGLPLARQFVEAHGGTLTLLSEPGRGTAVTVELPRK